jgi:acyl transferase domain-containing protein/acyl carrier protein/SAM-dependent methyltransferase
LLTELSKDLQRTRRQSHLFAIFGIGDCVPLSPFHKDKLRIKKLNVLSFLQSSPVSSFSAQYTFSKNAIAVVGAACRLPGANDLEELWDLMSRGVSKAEEVDLRRFDYSGSFRASQDMKWTSKHKLYANFIENVDAFDNAFFGVSEKEATYMDPQQRLLLETAFQAMDSSGYLRSHQRENGDTVGCFIGASFTEYLDNTSAYASTAFTATGTIRAFLCGKISHFFGWTGPSEVIDTACSASLVAVHRACQALVAGECPIALAGGVNIITGIHNFLDMGKAGFLSPTGQCKPFDQAADGYCRADGVGLVVLKPLQDAVADGDQILGVIPASGTNQGGLSTTITVPHSPAQVALYRGLLHKAGVEADQVSYVEAHGTGTKVGDPVEMASIREVFGGTKRASTLHVGSLKANIGHSETSAGVASLLKVLAMIKHKSIPPLAGFGILNPEIQPLTPDKISIASEVVPWAAPIRIACVNSYGAAGSNSALLCCEWPQQQHVGAPNENRAPYPVFLSAESKESLRYLADSLRSHIQREGKKLTVGDVAFTLSERRKHHRIGSVIIASDMSSLSLSLEKCISDSFETPPKPKPVVLIFSGQSKQVVELDPRLYQTYSCLRSHLNLCNELLTKFGFPAIIPAIFQSEPISDLITLHCGTFALQYACARSWIDAGLEVSAVIGHSFGELTALVVSGVLSLDDGLKLIATRASLMKTKWGTERGTMLAIHGNREVVQDLIASVRFNSSDSDLEIACYNSMASHVVVGSSSSIARAEEIMKTESRFSSLQHQRLDVSYGFHSRFTETLLEELDIFSRTLSFNKTTIPLEFCSRYPTNTVDPDHISKHTREPVYFVDTIRRLERRLGPCVWLEAGMDSPIVGMAKRALDTPAMHVFQSLNTKRAQDPVSVISETTKVLWQEGISTSFWAFLSPLQTGLKQVWLPPYQFQRTSFWLENVDRVIEEQKSLQATTMLGSKSSHTPTRLVTLRENQECSTSAPRFTIRIDSQRYWDIVSAHAVRGKPLCPASMYMECVVMAAQIMGSDLVDKALYFRDMSFQNALGIDWGRDISLSLERHGDLSWTFSVQSSLSADSYSRLITHATGEFGLVTRPDFKIYERLINSLMTGVVNNPNSEKLMSRRAYDLFSKVVQYSACLRGISQISLNGSEAVAEIKVPETSVDITSSTVTNICDAVTLDTFIQVVGFLINTSDICAHEEAFIAGGIDSISMLCNDLYRSKSWKVYAKFTPLHESCMTGDIFVFTANGLLAMTALGARFSKVPIAKLDKLIEAANPNHAAKVISGQQVISPVTPSLPTRVVRREDKRDINRQTEISSRSSDNSQIPTPSSMEERISTLKALIASYIGLSETEVGDDTNLEELGLDSLAEVELRDELESVFGKEIPSGELRTNTFGALRHLLISSPRSMTRLAVMKKSLPTFSEAAITHTETEYSPSSTDSAKSYSCGRQRVLQMISEICGAPMKSFEDDATLEEIGVDSLSGIELRSSIEEGFSTIIEDDHWSLKSTVKEIVAYLPVGNEVVPKAAITAAPRHGVSRVTTTSNVNHEITVGKVVTCNVIQRNASTLTVDPIQALAQSQESFDASARRFGFVNYWADVAPRLDELLLVYISEAFLTLGVDLRRLQNGDIVPPIPHQPRYTKAVQRWLEILERLEIIKRNGDTVIRTSHCVAENSEAVYKRFVEHFPHYSCDAKVMALTGPRLADCISGAIEPAFLMFGNQEDQQVLEDFYTSSPLLATLAEQLVDFVKRVTAGTSNTPVRILEIGAGFGGATKNLVCTLQNINRPVEYIFCNPSHTLVENARAKFAGYAWMDFQVLSIDAEVPDCMKSKYDIVIGSCCIHAARDKSASANRMRQMLKPGGFIVLSEVTRIIDWYDVVFGLLDGWWLATDGSIYPLQTANRWMDFFNAAGFTASSYSSGCSAESETSQLLVGTTSVF